jgi:hypothetical protein
VSCYQDDDWKPKKLAASFEAFLPFLRDLKEPGDAEGADDGGEGDGSDEDN